MKTEEKFIPTRKSLLGRLKNQQDDDSWRDFFNTYWKFIYSVAVRSGCTDSEAEEVVQETIISVSKTMRGFKYDPAVCSFKNWLMRIIRWRISDQLRRRGRQHERDGRSLLTEEDAVADGKLLVQPELDAVWQEEWERNLVDAAMERVKKQVSAEQYQIFHLLLIKKLPLSEVAAMLQINVGRVYLAKHRVSKLVKREIKKLEKRQA
jgi:RNA polymerase sigma factor (sigma-70 family)